MTWRKSQRSAQRSTRIDRGQFGICSACGRPISRERLAVVPTAVTCIACAPTVLHRWPHRQRSPQSAERPTGEMDLVVMRKRLQPPSRDDQAQSGTAFAQLDSQYE